MHEKAIIEWKGELQIFISPVQHFTESCLAAEKYGEVCSYHTVNGHNWSRDYVISITLNFFYYQANFKLINPLKFA